MVNKTVSCGKLWQHCASLPFFSIDDYRISVPAAGYRNGTSLNNEGSNGNYWSSTPNENNSNNAYNLNFNDNNYDWNNNNRNNGQSVRPVLELTKWWIYSCRIVVLKYQKSSFLKISIVLTRMRGNINGGVCINLNLNMLSRKIL